MNDDARRKAVALTARIASVIALVALLTLALVPPETLEHGPTLCLFKAILGRDCPGCGMTKAVAALLHGDTTQALARNRFVVVVFPSLVFAVLLPAAISEVVRRHVKASFLYQSLRTILSSIRQRGR